MTWFERKTKLDSELDVLTHVVTVLEAMHVPYMVGGSTALAVWASPRTTHDVDIVVDIPEERIDEFCRQFSQDRYFIDADVMRDAFSHLDGPGLGMYSFIDMESGLKIDLFPLRPGDDVQESALRQRIRAKISTDIEAAVYSPGDLLVQKLRWFAASGSERQFKDCMNLLLTDSQREEPMIDLEYVENSVSRLSTAVQAAWATVKIAVGTYQ